jgi:hypothetical protein
MKNLNLARLPIPPRGRTQSSRPGWRQAIAAGGTNWRNINKPPARRKRQPALNHKINAGVAGNLLQVSFRAGQRNEGENKKRPVPADNGADVRRWERKNSDSFFICVNLRHLRAIPDWVVAGRPVPHLARAALKAEWRRRCCGSLRKTRFRIWMRRGKRASLTFSVDCALFAPSGSGFPSTPGLGAKGQNIRDIREIRFYEA